MKKYDITEGTFRDSDGTVKGVGDTIELDDDMAAVHAGRVRLAPSESEEKATANDVQAPAQTGAGLDQVEH